MPTEAILLETEFFPPKLESLEIDSNYYPHLLINPNTLPGSLKFFSVGSGQIQFTDLLSSNNYPSCLEHLSIARLKVHDEQSLSKYIPSALKTLSLNLFLDPLTNILPSTLTDLVLYRFQNTLQVGDSPPTLQSLRIEFHLGIPINLIPGLLPPSLRILSIGSISNETLGPNILPGGVLQFVLGSGTSNLCPAHYLPH